VSATRRAPALRLATAAMGTRFELLIPAEDPERWRAAGEEAIDTIEECHRRYSRFASDSLLSYINRIAADRPVRLDSETFAILQDALSVQQESGGAFDITVSARQPLSVARASGTVAAKAEGTAAAVELDCAKNTVRFGWPGVGIDLGGIAKGHALDRAGALLRGHGVRSALLHGGTSSVLAIGGPAEGIAWSIVLAFRPDSPPIQLRDAALSVSAATRSTLDDHLIDPRGDVPVQSGRAAAVIGPSARLADAWSTALAVLGFRPSILGQEWEAILL
jgi:thiamine biosynthesis lipoprotein